MIDNTQELGYTHPDEMPIVEHSPNPHSDLRGTIVHFTSEMLDNPNDYGIYPTTNFYNDLEEAILEWHNKQTLELLDRLRAAEPDYSEMDSYNRSFLKAMYENTIGKAIQAERAKLKEVK